MVVINQMIDYNCHMKIEEEIRNLKESISLAELVRVGISRRGIDGLAYINETISDAIQDLNTALIFLESVYEIDKEEGESRLLGFIENEKQH